MGKVVRIATPMLAAHYTKAEVCSFLGWQYGFTPHQEWLLERYGSVLLVIYPDLGNGFVELLPPNTRIIQP